MEFSRQDNWTGLTSPPPGDPPNPGIKLSLSCLLHWQADSLLLPPGKPIMTIQEPLKEQAWFPQAAVCVGEGVDSRHFLNKVGADLR